MTRATKVVVGLACGILAAVVPGLAHEPSYSSPPTDLHLVGDHWTAWNPPTEFPEGVEVHIIQRGDTLWDLAGQYLGDPYLWPQLWEQNQYILDAHWIYPGDPLVVGFEVTPVDTLADVPEAEVEPEPAAPEFGAEGGRLRAAGYPADVYCTGFVDDPELTFAYHVIGSEEGALGPSLRSQERPRKDHLLKVDLTTSDIVYLDAGAGSGLDAGGEYFIVGSEELVRHPHSNDLLGRYYQYQGRLRVLSVQADTAIAEVTDTCRAVHVGAGLMPFETLPIPLVAEGVPPTVNDPVTDGSLDAAGTVVYSENDVFSLGEGSILYLDLGEGEAAPGDTYRIWRRNHEGLPPVVLGELAILRVGPSTSVARVLNSRYTIRVGDRITL